MKIIEFIRRYSIRGIISLAYDLAITKLFYKQCRLIRRPFYIRGAHNIVLGKRFTTGVGCRIEVINEKFNSDILINIGENVQINDYVHIAAIENVKIGNNVLIASKVFISDHNHGNYSGDNTSNPLIEPLKRELFASKIVIEDNVWIGELVTVLPGVTIGKGAIIGANSLVNKNIPPYSISVGIPAKVIKKYDFKNKCWIRV